MTFAEVQAQVTLLKHQHRVWSHLPDQLSAYLTWTSARPRRSRWTPAPSGSFPKQFYGA